MNQRAIERARERRAAEQPVTVASRPPASMRPDRAEVVTAVGSGRRAELEPGIWFEALVGAHNLARNLTTGLMMLPAGAKSGIHVHRFSESTTLLRGAATVEVEGRPHELDATDNVVIPGGVAHRVVNRSASEPAVLHVAWASDRVDSTAVVARAAPATAAERVNRPATAAERVNRPATSARYAAGPNTSFIDFFNADLIPGLEMSGGYARFQPGGRLPAHVHDFDESICIVEGTAACIVEGRRYTLSDGATAMVPRGRVHYFVNQSAGPMAMLWVYAGPRPVRLVVAEACATVEGNPWQGATT